MSESKMREALAALVRLIPWKEDGDGNAPGHCHERPGIWDSDNAPQRADKPCEWCAAWFRARALLAAAPEAPDEGRAERIEKAARNLLDGFPREGWPRNTPNAEALRAALAAPASPEPRLETPGQRYDRLLGEMDDLWREMSPEERGASHARVIQRRASPEPEGERRDEGWTKPYNLGWGHALDFAQAHGITLARTEGAMRQSAPDGGRGLSLTLDNDGFWLEVRDTLKSAAIPLNVSASGIAYEVLLANAQDRRASPRTHCQHGVSTLVNCSKCHLAASPPSPAPRCPRPHHLLIHGEVCPDCKAPAPSPAPRDQCGGCQAEREYIRGERADPPFVAYSCGSTYLAPSPASEAVAFYCNRCGWRGTGPAYATSVEHDGCHYAAFRAPAPSSPAKGDKP